ncbi:MAG: DinB family protein [Acidobacteria bacterium]|nr:DinB family protein [Acidobacteriota bacterium]
MNPYQASLGSRDPLTSLAETPDRIRELVGRMGTADFTRPHAPGKWNAREILVHLAQAEMAFGMRVRLALSSATYVVQPFDQDAWMAREPLVEATAALAAYYAMRRWNLPLFRSLSPEERAKTFQHPERGAITISTLLETLAGHELHHLTHLERIAAQTRA